MCQHRMITPHQAYSPGYEIVVTMAANPAPVAACCVTSLAWCFCASGVIWHWPCKYSMTKQRVMKALSGVCTNSLSLNLGSHCNVLMASLSLPHSLSTCARVIGISPGSFIPFTGNTGFTLSAFVCYPLQIFRYSSLLFVIPLGLVAEACLHTVPQRWDRREERGGWRNEPQTVNRAYRLWTPECRQLPKCYEYLCLYVCLLSNRKCFFARQAK